MAELDFYMHIYGTKDAVNVEELSSADVVERKHGKWVDMYDGWVCTACNEKNDYSKLFNFCPTCGADMRGEDDV